jgi:hypothetical protein
VQAHCKSHGVVWFACAAEIRRDATGSWHRLEGIFPHARLRRSITRNELHANSARSSIHDNFARRHLHANFVLCATSLRIWDLVGFKKKTFPKKINEMELTK